MLLPITSPIRRMPARELCENHATVRAAPIVEVWPAMPGFMTPALVVVQLDGERQAIPVTEQLAEELVHCPPDAHLVVTGAGRMSWVRRDQLKPQE